MKKITLIAFLITITIVTYGQWSGSTDTNNNIWRIGNVGIGTISPNSTVPGPLLEISSNGDFFPVLRLERVNGTNKTNKAWETFISSNGSYYIRDISTSTNSITDPFIIQTGAPTNSFNISGNGNIGIGTNIPDNKLHVFVGESGGASFTNSTLTLENNTSNFLQFLSPNTDVQGIMFGDPEQAYAGYVRYSHGDNSMRFWTNNSEKLTILSNGNIGIGTTSTGTHKLAVDGTIGAREIIVETGAWSDFVFDDNYKLKDLEEVENFIEENNHLPDIPSEKEVLENGIQVGEMNAKLLQKIEELTLYMIEQNKKTDKLIEKVDKLESENELLKNEISTLKTQ